MADKESDLKGICFTCLVKQRNALNAALCRVVEIIDSGDNLSNEAFYGTEHGWWRSIINRHLPK